MNRLITLWAPVNLSVALTAKWDVKQGICCRRMFRHELQCGNETAFHTFSCMRCVANCGILRLLSMLCKKNTIQSLKKFESLVRCIDVVVLLARFVAYNAPDDIVQRQCFMWRPLKQKRQRLPPEVRRVMKACQNFEKTLPSTPPIALPNGRVQSALDDSDDEDLQKALNIYETAKQKVIL